MKRLSLILPLALILCFMVGCQDKEALAELEEFKAQAVREEKNIEFVKKYLEEMDKQNFDFHREMYADDFVMHMSGTPKPIGANMVYNGMQYWYKDYPDYTHTVEEILAMGNKVVVRLKCIGTYKGKYYGNPPSGTPIEHDAVQIWKVQDGKMVEAWILEDRLTLSEQLGMELKPREREK
jgi:steroid delta-isomerase-like uncharacterized protein